MWHFYSDSNFWFTEKMFRFVACSVWSKTKSSLQRHGSYQQPKTNMRTRGKPMLALKVIWKGRCSKELGKPCTIFLQASVRLSLLAVFVKQQQQTGGLTKVPPKRRCWCRWYINLGCVTLRYYPRVQDLRVAERTDQCGGQVWKLRFEKSHDHVGMLAEDIRRRKGDLQDLRPALWTIRIFIYSCFLREINMRYVCIYNRGHP